MPRNVRNFWLELTVDGKTTRVETGPQAKNGGFSLVMKQRTGGSIITSMIIDGRVTVEGLRLQAELIDPPDDAAGELTRITQR